MSVANVRGRLRSRAGAVGAFVEEGARAALEMAVVSAAVRYASVGGITLYEASRR